MRVVALQDEQLILHGGIAPLGEIDQGIAIAQTLANLRTIDLEVVAVQPVVGKGLARRSLALSNLVAVVYRNMINPTSVDVERRTKEVHCNRRAFQVPPREAHHWRAVCWYLVKQLRWRGPLHVALNTSWRELP